jgi:hypothetical protein
MIISHMSKFSSGTHKLTYIRLEYLLMWLIFIGCWVNYPQFFKGNLERKEKFNFPQIYFTTYFNHGITNPVAGICDLVESVIK